MIIFSWTLTPNQIVCLRSVAAHQSRYEEAARNKKRLRFDENPLAPGMSHFLSACRGLLREGFIIHKEVPLQKWEITSDIKTRQCWEITQKGLLMLELVSIEIEEQSRVLSGDKKQLKLLQAA